jgi:hypothetical protein
MDVREGEPDERNRKVDYVVPSTEIDVVDLPPVEVSDIDVDQQSVSFTVDEVGVPVLVRVSYFPNWSVSGAEGPYRVSPNFMVVIPTENEVELTYGRTMLDWFFYALTLVGIGLCVVWRVQGDLRYDSERPRFGRRAPDVEGSEPGDAVAAETLSSAGPDSVEWGPGPPVDPFGPVSRRPRDDLADPPNTDGPRL